MPKSESASRPMNRDQKGNVARESDIKAQMRVLVKEFKNNNITEAAFIRNTNRLRDALSKVSSKGSHSAGMDQVRRDGGARDMTVRDGRTGDAKSFNKGGMVSKKKSTSYNKGGMVKSNCGASMKPGQKSRGK